MLIIISIIINRGMNMKNEKQSSSQFETYSEIIKKISSKCNQSNFVEINENGWERTRHYILDGDIHVYISEDSRFIEVSNGNPYHYPEREDSVVVNLRMDNELDVCSFFIHGEIGNIIEGICMRYGKEFYYNHEVEEETRDTWFLPSNVEPWQGNSTRMINPAYGELTLSIRELLEEAIHRSKNTKTKNAYTQALKHYDKIIHVANRDEKITPAEALKNALRTISEERAHEAATVEEEELHHGEKEEK